MSLHIHVTMPDGSVWSVPAMLVAEPRARHYAEHDSGETQGSAFNDVYGQELAYTLGDANELTDWAQNNMDWSDVADHARPIKAPPHADYQEGWVNGEMDVVDEPD